MTMTTTMTTRTRTTQTLLLMSSLWLLLPANAWALCPNCLGQNRSLTPTLELLGAFLLVPFVVALVVLRVIRKALR
jgi:hypothetical protein